MKKIWIATIAALFVAVGVVQADISVEWSTVAPGGFYGQGGSWAGGTWLDGDALFQLIWSQNDPVASSYMAYSGTANYLDDSGNEVLLTSFNVPANGSSVYGQFAPYNAGVWSNQDVGGLNINNGYVYARVFRGGTPTQDMWYFQSAPTGSTLSVYDPLNVLTAVGHEMSGGSARELGSQVQGVIPEPATWAFMGLGALVAFIRRRMIRA